jgi:hypothetical protein
MGTLMVIQLVGSGVIGLWCLAFKERPLSPPSAIAKKIAEVSGGNKTNIFE